MCYPRKSLLSATVLSVVVLFFIVMFPVTSMPSSTSMTNAEYKALLENPEFWAADEDLNMVYNMCLNASKNEAERNEYVQNQRQWLKWRNEEAAKRFKKGSPAYIQYIIDRARHQAGALTILLHGGNVASVKAYGFFGTLDYDKISYDGIIKPEHRPGSSGVQATAVAEKTGPKKTSVGTDSMEWMSPAEAAKQQKASNYMQFDENFNIIERLGLSHEQGHGDNFGRCGGGNYNKQKDAIRYYECLYSLCSLMVQGKYIKKELLYANNERDISEFIKLCPAKVKEAKKGFEIASERVRRENEARQAAYKAQQDQQLVAQQARQATMKAREDLANQMKEIAVTRIKESRYRLFSDSSYPPIGKAFDAYFGTPKKWQGSTYGLGGEDIAVAFEGITMFKGNKAKIIIWFTNIGPSGFSVDSPFRQGRIKF